MDFDIPFTFQFFIKVKERLFGSLGIGIKNFTEYI